MSNPYAIHSLSGELSRLALLSIAILAIGCGSASHKNARAEPFIDEEALKANRLAPDLVARARSAHNEALLAENRGDRLEAQQYSTCARLFLEAAQIEAERVELERQRREAQERVDRAKALKIRHLRARQNIEREVALFQASQNAKPRDSFDSSPTKERGGKQHNRSFRRAARKRSNELALKRARLYLASAIAMGADDRIVEKARRAIRDAQYQPAGSASSALKAEQALFSAVDALSAARAKNDGPTRDEKNTLLNEARNEGFSVELLPTGAVVELTEPFVRSSSVLSDRGKAETKKLLYLARAHPHGAIEIRLHTGSTESPNRKRLAHARAARMISSLSMDESKRSRFTVAFDTFSPDEKDDVKLIFVAYGMSQRQNDP